MKSHDDEMGINDAKKARMSGQGVKPSSVIHLRELPDQVTEADLAELVAPFGEMRTYILTGNRKAAMIEMGDVTAAQNMIEYFAHQPPKLHGCPIQIQFSKHERLTGRAVQQKDSMAVVPATGESQCVLRILVDNMIHPVTLDTLKEIFSHYGFVQKIITFYKNGTFHALIQYENKESAQSAKSYLDSQNIYTGCCTLRVHFSNLSSLHVRFNNDKSRDYTNSELPYDEGTPWNGSSHGGNVQGSGNSFGGNSYSNGSGYGGSNYDAFNMAGLMPTPGTTGWGAGGERMGSMPNTMAGRGAGGPMMRPRGASGPYGNSGPNVAPYDIARSGKSRPFGGGIGDAGMQARPSAPYQGMMGTPQGAYPGLMGPGPTGYQGMGNTMGLGMSGAGPDAMLAMMMQDMGGAGGAGCGTVVLASNLNEQKVTPDALFRLFGVYGDVLRVKILFKKKDAAFIQFVEPLQAQRAVANLDNVWLWGKQMKISPSRHPSVQLPKEGQADSHLTRDYQGSQMHRFRNPLTKNHNHVVMPSATLHLSSIPATMNEETIRSTFGKFGTIVAFKFFENNRRMALVQMQTLEQATEALVDMDGTDNMRVSFTKSTIKDGY